MGDTERGAHGLATWHLFPRREIDGVRHDDETAAGDSPGREGRSLGLRIDEHAVRAAQEPAHRPSFMVGMPDMEVRREDERSAGEARGQPREVVVRERDRVCMNDVVGRREAYEETAEFGRERAGPGPQAAPVEQLLHRGARRLHRAAPHAHAALGVRPTDGYGAGTVCPVPELILLHGAQRVNGDLVTVLSLPAGHAGAPALRPADGGWEAVDDVQDTHPTSAPETWSAAPAGSRSRASMCQRPTTSPAFQSGSSPGFLSKSAAAPRQSVRIQRSAAVPGSRTSSHSTWNCASATPSSQPMARTRSDRGAVQGLYARKRYALGVPRRASGAPSSSARAGSTTGARSAQPNVRPIARSTPTRSRPSRHARPSCLPIGHRPAPHSERIVYRYYQTPGVTAMQRARRGTGSWKVALVRMLQAEPSGRHD